MGREGDRGQGEGVAALGGAHRELGCCGREACGSGVHVGPQTGGTRARMRLARRRMDFFWLACAGGARCAAEHATKQKAASTGVWHEGGATRAECQKGCATDAQAFCCRGGPVQRVWARRKAWAGPKPARQACQQVACGRHATKARYVCGSWGRRSGESVPREHMVSEAG